MEQNSFRAFVRAARPATLTAALAPVLLGLALSWADLTILADYNDSSARLRLVPAVLCLLFALVMQVDANLINDYYDWRRGVDDEGRLGPERMCQAGLVTPAAMRRAIALTTLTGCIIGMPLALYGGFAMVLIGVLCVAFSFLYTTALAHRALGDVLVVVFFGLVPVAATYYLQTHGTPYGPNVYSGLTRGVVLAALAQGLVCDGLLLVNNYRDRETDVAHGKRTLATLFGPEAIEILYMMLGLVAFALCLPLLHSHPRAVYPLPLFVFTHFLVWRRMTAIGRGRELNRVLFLTSLNILFFALLLGLGVNL